MAEINEKKKRAKEHLKKHRQKLMKQGLCRDCGLNPAVAPDTEKRKRKPTLCEDCRKSRRDGAAKRRAKVAEVS